MLVLGLETSCDETAVGIVSDEAVKDLRIRANSVASQFVEHKPYGGVVPEIAARAHLDRLDDLVKQALNKAGATLADMSGIAATCGPGLIGGVMVGAMMGKAFAAVRCLPFMAVNHLEAHALTARLTDDVPFPYLLLLVSGGHCQLLLVRGVGDYHRLGSTLDDAVGECFDKGAKLLGLGYPGGPLVERAALSGNPKAFDLPRPLVGRTGCDFSFSGLKTALRLLVSKERGSQAVPSEKPSFEGTLKEEIVSVRKDVSSMPLSPSFIADAAASLQATIAAILFDRTKNALDLLLDQNQRPNALVVAGGVAANHAIRGRLTELGAQYRLPFVAPPINLCTDNGVMVAWAGLERLRLGLTDALDFAARPRWSLDQAHPLRERRERDSEKV